MSTPTPDPPPAGSPLGSTLTAEQIAVMQGFATTWQKMGGRAVNAQLAGQCLGDTLDSHAALRDRLARAEARCAALEGAIDGELGIYSPRYDEQRTVNARNERMCRSERVQRLRALLTTPTDGAARAGDAAGDEGETR